MSAYGGGAWSDRRLDVAVESVFKDVAGFLDSGKRWVMSGVESRLPCSLRRRISPQSQSSTPPILKVTFLPYIPTLLSVITLAGRKFVAYLHPTEAFAPDQECTC